MSPKELLYIEDALNHEKHMKSCCTQNAECLSDPSLKNMVSDMAAKHQAVFDKLYQLLQ
ncbi:MAG: hypothetical protein IIW34_03870 [Clostridia bacterium]|nr:hypothetical protein [Clostridia bacterium]MBQ2326341.1 hypothetical protein [Clostridia bacterium]MBQ5813268.1 hypothetical protein [Clostridia bacterium]